MLGIARTTFYRWYAHYRLDGEAALQDKVPLPVRIWNRIPDTVRSQLITLALDRPELKLLRGLRQETQQEVSIPPNQSEWDFLRNPGRHRRESGARRR